MSSTDVIVKGDASGFAQEIVVGPHRLTADEPIEAGGKDTGPSPYDLLLAALGSCTSMTVAMYARTEEVAARECDGESPTLEDSCGGLPGLRNEGRQDRPNRARDSFRGKPGCGTTEKAARDCGQVSRSTARSNPRLIFRRRRSERGPREPVAANPRRCPSPLFGVQNSFLSIPRSSAALHSGLNSFAPPALKGEKPIGSKIGDSVAFAPPALFERPEQRRDRPDLPARSDPC